MIQSGTTTERLLRVGILTVLVWGYSAWSLWDGYRAYPRRNIESAFREKIGVEPPRPLPQGDPNLTEARIDDITSGLLLDEVAARLGPPAARAEGHAYYFGYGGLVDVVLRGENVIEVNWIEGPKHRPTDLLLQKIIGLALVPLGAFLVAVFIRALATRAILDHTGLKMRGQELISYDAMIGIRSDPKKRAGRFELTYAVDGRTKVLALDDYMVRETTAIVREICRRKGFTVPADCAARDGERRQSSD